MTRVNHDLSRRRRIAFCVRDMQVGGVENALLATLDAILGRGDTDVCVITYAPVRVPQFQQWFAAHPDVKLYTLYPARWLGTKLVRFAPLRLIQHLARDIYRWARRGKIRSRQFADIDVFIDYYNFSFVREFRKITAPRIAWWHSSIDVFWHAHAPRHMKNYDRLVMLTDGAAMDVRAAYPAMADKVCSIFNPIDGDKIHAASADAPRAGMRDYFVAVSRLSADKDVGTILRAFDLFWGRAGRPDISLVLVGDGHLGDELRALARTLDARDKIVFVGTLANPYGYMAGARGHILSSYGEGLPCVLVEAATVGTLNIASDCHNGPREILMDGAAGILFAPGDVGALADIMTDVWAGRVDATGMRRRATRGLGRFASKKIADEITAMINELI